MSVRQIGGACARASLFQAFAIVAVCGLVTAAQASIMYGDFIAPDLMYQGVAESSGTDPVPPPLFGAPEVRNNGLDFDPMGFVSTTMGGPLDITDGQLNFGIMMAPGIGITELVIEESGDFSFAGLGGLGTSVTAGVSVWVEVLEVDGAPVSTPTYVQASTSYSTNMDAMGMTTLAPWDLSLTVDLSSALGSAYLGVTKAEVVIDNQLITNSEGDSLAFIAKKDFKVDPVTINIPEPASLAVLAVIGLLIRRR